MWLFRFNQRIAFALKWYWPLRAHGLERFEKHRGASILAANHASVLDPWFIGMLFERPVRYLMTDRWFHRSKMWNAVFRAFGTIPVQVGDTGGTMEVLLRALDRGEVVGMFPEGRITLDGRLGRFRPGLARLAAASGAPTVPVGIRGARSSLPPDRRWPRRVAVDVHFGEPMHFPGAPLQLRPRREELQWFNTAVRQRVAELAGQADIGPRGNRPERGTPRTLVRGSA